jgi:16S rRNA A1518/A1519 N6-dimethyltransferase RsmA/KsgA/DIM1 with predicted DNA glycosylase/AP lyase activity
MKLDFTLAQLATLDKAIQQLPYYVAAPLIAHINAELEAQQKIMDTPIELKAEQ